MKLAKMFLIIVLMFSVTGCLEWWDGPSGPNTPDALYRRGQEAYQEGDYKDAIEIFQRVTGEYPLSDYAIPAELGVADSYFSDGDYVSAEVNYSDFMEFHPTSKNLPYVMHQIGICHYRQTLGIDRDQTEAHLAEKAFERLISRFPSSKFSFSAEKKLKECRKKLGEHEFYVGRFYFNIGQYHAALRRFKTIEDEYARLGMDYKIGYFIRETERRLAEEERKKRETE
ncbi:MAG: outer membrane protein assembly factor BamD [Deltaproteobacteria bacterium]|nr:outer membrane protein assembly factor BamD [Deltaproteobacteria bacterium]MBW2594877.1 outer membrane protein assembly factor BamD [Deltaproteobacteria bacterium]MBW2651436.1 outer membrane protein assembly factor BamD [Deltaproteobacteria bacterium]